MVKKKLFVIIAVFVAYCILLLIISVNSSNNSDSLMTGHTAENAEQSSSLNDHSSMEANIGTVEDLLSSEAYTAAHLENKTEADTPWKSSIELLGADCSEQGLFMMPGTAITYTTQIPAGARLKIAAKIFDSIAELGISDGVSFVFEIIQDGQSLRTYTPIIVSGDGKVKLTKLDLSEWQGQTLQIKLHCYDGGNDDANGDWSIINSLELEGIVQNENVQHRN